MSEIVKLEGLYTQLEAELPNHLKTHLKLEADENHGCINIVFKDMGKLGKENFRQLRSLLEEAYDAEFINPAFPAQPYYQVKVKCPVALPSEDAVEKAVRDALIKKAQALNIGIPDASLLSMPLQKLETLVKTAAKVTPPQTETKQKTQENKPEIIKQPSPITIFSATYCGVCEDYGVSCSCQSNSERRSLCLKILAIQTWKIINVNLEKLCKVGFSQPAQATSSNHADARSPPATQPVQKVERNTHPTEGHREGDVVWIYAENQKGERYEKALEKDNQRSNDYFELRGQIVERINAGKKGLELNGKWLWLSDRDDYIGRKVAKEFPKGARR